MGWTKCMSFSTSSSEGKGIKSGNVGSVIIFKN
jgi:hypothetical protein